MDDRFGAIGVGRDHAPERTAPGRHDLARPEILSSEWMLIGRQEQTGMGGRIDLLAIAPDASLVLIELKRDRTPREIVAQAIDYASWVEKLTAERLEAQLAESRSTAKRLMEAVVAELAAPQTAGAA